VTTRPYAADDFTAIRARLEELRRERDHGEAQPDGRSPVGPRHSPSTVTGDTEHEGDLLRRPRPSRWPFVR
jgi:hypothetical protein